MAALAHLAPQLPALSVVMSVYNGARFLDAAICSVREQTFSDFEFLILDDGSDDGSLQIIRAHAAEDQRIRPIYRENRGLITSLNELLARAHAPLIARMDADDICAPDRFARQISFLANHPDHGVVGSQVAHINEAGTPFLTTVPDYPHDHAGIIKAIATSAPLLCHPAVMYRRDAVLGAGGYHAAFQHCEDFDLWLRLASATRLANLPERLLQYRHYAGQISARHTLEQQTGAAIARIAYQARQGGKPDPSASWVSLPPLEDLDALFTQPGTTRQVREIVARNLLYSLTGLRDQGFHLLLDHLADGGAHDGMWRTVARLVRFGMPAHAARLARQLITTHSASGKADHGRKTPSAGATKAQAKKPQTKAETSTKAACP